MTDVCGISLMGEYARRAGRAEMQSELLCEIIEKLCASCGPLRMSDVAHALDAVARVRNDAIRLADPPPKR